MTPLAVPVAGMVAVGRGASARTPGAGDLPSSAPADVASLDALAQRDAVAPVDGADPGTRGPWDTAETRADGRDMDDRICPLDLGVEVHAVRQWRDTR